MGSDLVTFLNKYDGIDLFNKLRTSKLSTPAVFKILEKVNRLKQFSENNNNIIKEFLPSIEDEYKRRLKTVAALLTPLEYSVVVSDLEIVRKLMVSSEPFLLKFKDDNVDETHTKHNKTLLDFSKLRVFGFNKEDAIPSFINKAQTTGDSAIIAYDQNKLTPRKLVDPTNKNDDYYLNVFFNNVLAWKAAKASKTSYEEVLYKDAIEEAEKDFKEGKPFNKKYELKPADKKGDQLVNENSAKWYTYTYYVKKAEKQGKDDALAKRRANIARLDKIKNLITKISTDDPQNPTALEQDKLNKKIEEAYQDKYQEYSDLVYYTGFLDGIRAYNNINFLESEWTPDKMVKLAELGAIDLKQVDINHYNEGYDMGLNSLLDDNGNLLEEVKVHAENMAIEDAKKEKRYQTKEPIYLLDKRPKKNSPKIRANPALADPQDLQPRNNRIKVIFDFNKKKLNTDYAKHLFDDPENGASYKKRNAAVKELSKIYEDAYKAALNPRFLEASTADTEQDNEISISGGRRRLTRRRKIFRK